jgi:GntR family transcriptional regulator, rspAB operon transcriptional repressor
MMDRSRYRLTNQVFDKIRDDIVSGRLAAEAPLSEAAICEQLGVSRTPVREALIKLSEEELVVIYPHVGTFVAPISLEAVRVGQYIREHLECALVADAARNIDDEGRKRLRENIREQVAAAKNPDEFYRLDNGFHALIAELSGYAGTWNAILRAKTQFDRVRYLTVQDKGRVKEILAEHHLIADAIIRGDTVSATDSVRSHLRTVFANINKLGLEERKETPALRKKRLMQQG